MSHLCDEKIIVLLDERTIFKRSAFKILITHDGKINKVVCTPVCNCIDEQTVQPLLELNVGLTGVKHAYQRDYSIKLGRNQLQGFFMCNPLEPLNI